HLAGNDVGCSRVHVETPDRPYHARRLILLRDAFDGENDLRCAGKRVTAQIHGDGAGVPGFAGDTNLRSILSHNPGDNAERLASRFQTRALLDMDLDIG